MFRWCLAIALVPAIARAGVVEPDPRADDAFDVMNVLARAHLHELDDEWWNVYGQLTYIEQAKLPFSAAYTNLDQNPGGQGNSLQTRFESSFTATFTLYAGVRLWRGAELYLSPELLSELPLSDLTGLGGAVQNFELQKGGTPTPVAYLARAYLTQTLPLGGDTRAVDSNPLALGNKALDQRRITITAGRFSVLDFFDKNTYAGDLRRQFFNMAFMTYAAYDFTADTRGYTFGAVAELYWDRFAVRYARTAPPKLPNRGDLDLSFGLFDTSTSPGGKSYGDQIELEHDHELAGRPGAVRVLAYRNREYMGRFDDAIRQFESDPARYDAATCPPGSFANHVSNAIAPDLCWARAINTKLGIGINAEQAITPEIGVFLRAMYSDGQSEVEAFTPTDRSLSLGALARGGLWSRRNDYAGVGFGAGWISRPHADYLHLGGIDGFIGDGALDRAAELVGEAFYGVNLTSSIWLSGDYQLIVNPAFNSARGPVSIVGGRLHAEF